MSATTGYEPSVAVVGSCIATHSERAPDTNQHSVTFPRWYYVAALVAVVPAFFVGHPNTDVKELAQLERLAPKIERASTLSLEARDAVGRLITRQNALAPSADEQLQARRRVAVDRVTSALNAKVVASTDGARP